jgi:DNA-binding transcriptional LysR family regulator
MLDLKLLETFREVAARGSFSAAAEALSFTQPAVSQHVARLEKQVGARLFERDARGVSPTRAGLSLMRHAETLLEAARRAEIDVRSAAGVHLPEVSIGAFATAAAGLVPMALKELRAAHPDLRPRLRIIEDEPALDDLAAGRLDVALLIGSDLNPTPVRPGITAELVFEDPMLIALPPGHPLAHRTVVDLDELRDEPVAADLRRRDLRGHEHHPARLLAGRLRPERRLRVRRLQRAARADRVGHGRHRHPVARPGHRSPRTSCAADRRRPAQAPHLVGSRAGDADPQVTATVDALRIAAAGSRSASHSRSAAVA